MLLAGIVTPFFALTLNMTRLYHLTLFFLAPACILGGETILRVFQKIIGKAPGLTNLPAFSQRFVLTSISVILVLLFLFQVGFVYELTGDAVSSVPLSMQKMDKVTLYDSIATKQEVFSAEWVRHVTSDVIHIYADYPAKMGVLTSYGMVSRTQIFTILTNQSIDLSQYPNAEVYVYLRTVNVVCDRVVGHYQWIWNTAEISGTLNDMDKIYSNGGSDVYCRR